MKQTKSKQVQDANISTARSGQSHKYDEDIAPGRFDPQEDAHNYPVETGVAAAPSGGGAGGGGGPCG